MNIFDSLKNYLVGSYIEMKKVSWPTKNQTINYSVLVVALSVGVAFFFSLLDYAFSYGINLLINK